MMLFVETVDDAYMEFDLCLSFLSEVVASFNSSYFRVAELP